MSRGTDTVTASATRGALDASGAAGIDGNIDASVERALDFLHRRQLPSGELQVFMSTDHTLRRDRVADSSPFPTALIAYSLGFADSPTARAILDRSVRFLLAEMEGEGAWRYWTRQHQYHAVI